MKLRLANCVILAEDYETLRDWWMSAVDLDLKQEWSDDYHYAELAFGGVDVVGIADATEMGAEPRAPRQNTAIPQLRCDDVEGLLARVKTHGGTVLFGPTLQEQEGFWYGAFSDPEGNQVWVFSG